MLVKKIVLDEIDPRLQFDVRLQIALRRNAIGIMNNSPEPDRFRNYVKERDRKIRSLLRINDEHISIVFQGKEIYP